MKRKSMTV